MSKLLECRETQTRKNKHCGSTVKQFLERKRNGLKVNAVARKDNTKNKWNYPAEEAKPVTRVIIPENVLKRRKERIASPLSGPLTILEDKGSSCLSDFDSDSDKESNLGLHTDWANSTSTSVYEIDDYILDRKAKASFASEQLKKIQGIHRSINLRYDWIDRQIQDLTYFNENSFEALSNLSDKSDKTSDRVVSMREDISRLKRFFKELNEHEDGHYHTNNRRDKPSSKHYPSNVAVIATDVTLRDSSDALEAGNREAYGYRLFTLFFILAFYWYLSFR
ncbi:Piso0_001568 [Millerozyma farinosa CBS 7064]|uniref:Piso0_001568 protein n=1 Tax=Pichia sorbitophila (strain ATCC MYA-4447 / BCRC 22081 / CBS 7064 / NBRC 10061 / NRRL Y-12695) TaxID=559304 RepID=G8YNI2_PICSO|nr:Piso0_001568 [Millerozyma farinosa CBS 7064]